jgi:glycosyltransferase involved in cell wall biosynthesis
MRVAFVARWFPFNSEGEQFLEPEVRSLSRALDLILIPTRATKATLDFDLPGTRSVYIGALSADVWSAAAREVARNPLAVAQAFVRVFRPRYSLRSKLVNLMVFPKGVALADRLRDLAPDHIHVHWLTAPSTTVYVASMLTGIPWSMTAHAHDIFADNLVAQKVAHASFVRVISRRNCAHLKELVAAEAAGRCAVVYLGVEVPESTIEPPPRVPRIVSSARLHPMKGHRYLIEALAALRGRGVAFECDLIGDGELRAELEAMAASLGVADRVHFLGNIPHAEMLRRLSGGEYDLAAVPSVELPAMFDGIPVALTEAAAAGLPIVATDAGSIAEIVTEESGILVPQRDSAALANALERMLQDRELRLRMGRAGRAWVLDHFTTASTTNQLLRLFAAVPRARAAVARLEVTGPLESA